MARVPTYDSPQVQQQPGRPIQISGVAPDSSPIADGVKSFERGAQILADKQREETNAAVLQGAATALGEYQNNDLFNPENGVYATKGGAAIGISQTRLEAFDKHAVDIRNGLNSDEQRRKWDAYYSGQRQSYSGDLQKYEFKQIDKYKSDQANGFISTAKQTAVLNYQNPDQIARALRQIDAVTDSEGMRKGLPIEQVEALRLANRSAVYADVLQRQATDDPFVAQKRLKEYQGSMSADDLVRVGGMIENKVDRLQQKAEMAQLRAEAKAERTLGKIDAQIFSGIPATPEMWKAWGNSVRGTPAQDEFNQRVNQEAEIQQILGLPVAQQQAFVNKRIADLQEKGGTVQQLNAANRLQRAVAGGEKLRTEAPISFAQQREELDTDVYNPSAENASDVMADRIGAIQSMREKYGPTVAMKPLLPQEAAGIAAALEKATPEQQIQILGALHDTIGDRQAYMGALQQIRPNSPVTAVVGAISGKQKEIITATHVFKPNEVATSGDVAAKIALGESLINKTKQGKASDGKINFQMPKNDDLDSAIDSYVGDAYSGRPEAKMLDRQIVRAAYAGRSSEINGGSGTVDSGILDWAVKAAVGEVAKFNDADTFVPWGMDADDFALEARRKLVQAVSENKLGPPAMVDRLTLKPVGDGQYLVYRGNRKQPANTDGTGNLIITIGGEE